VAALHFIISNSGTTLLSFLIIEMPMECVMALRCLRCVVSLIISLCDIAKHDVDDEVLPIELQQLGLPMGMYIISHH
jgi:hypothetical protein